MNYWLLSDTHFGHSKMVAEGLQKVGYEVLIFNALCSKVAPNDIFVCLGDVAFYDTAYWHHYLLNCVQRSRSILVLGNHDRETMAAYYRYGWHFVTLEFKLKIYGKVILFSHAPVVGRTDFDINVHGHYHGDSHRNSEPLPDNQRLVYTELVTLKSLIGM